MRQWIYIKQPLSKVQKFCTKTKKNIMEYVGYLTLQTIVGEKNKAIVDLNKLKSKELTKSEKQYVNSIEPLIRNYNGGGYSAILGNGNKKRFANNV